MRKEALWQFNDEETMVHAVHEAGHAVVGHVIGRLIEEVSIVSDSTSGYKGYCRFSAFIESANGHNEWQEANKSLDHITIMYAGTAAVEIICNLHGWDYKLLQQGDVDDRVMVNRLCRELFADEKQRRQVKRERLRQAKEILLGHWEAVDTLATELLQVGWVTGGEAHLLIQQASGLTEADWRLRAWGIGRS